MKNQTTRSTIRCTKTSLVAAAALLLPAWDPACLMAQSPMAQSSMAQSPMAQSPTLPSTLTAMVAVPSAIAAPATAVGAQPSGYEFSPAVGPEQLMHLVVGRSSFIKTTERLRKVYVANPAVLESYTADPNQIVVTAKMPGISTIVLWDEAGHSQSYLVSCDMNVDPLRTALQQSLPMESIQVEGNEGRVLLSGTVTTVQIADAAVKLAALYAKDVASSLVVNPSKIKQVRLKVRIVEVDRSRLTQFGINILGSGANTVGSGTTSQFPVLSSLTTTTGSSPNSTSGTSTIQATDPLNFLLYSTKLNIGVTVKDLENKQVLQILAEPTITTLSGQKANFLAGGEFPFPVVQGGSGGLNSVTVQFRPYGVKLEFTPNVNADGTIELKVAPEVSALDYANAAVISGYTIPALSTRRAETQAVLKSGQSFAISGLLDRRTSDGLSRTPGIANIPILGQLFKSKNYNHSVNELIVIVTPTIVDPLAGDVAYEEPAQVVPTLDPKTYDSALPKSLTSKP